MHVLQMVQEQLSIYFGYAVQAFSGKFNSISKRYKSFLIQELHANIAFHYGGLLLLDLSCCIIRIGHVICE